MRQGIRLHWSGIRHPQTQGKVERFHGSLQRALEHRGSPQPPPASLWLDNYRWEHNHVRPHEALGIRKHLGDGLESEGPRQYDPQPPRWEYPSGAQVRKVDSSGKVKWKGRNWNINQALAGEWVQIVATGERWMVFYCTTLIREIDPVASSARRSSSAGSLLRPEPSTVKDVRRHFVNHVMGLDTKTKTEKVGHPNLLVA